MSKNITWHGGDINYQERCDLLGQKGHVYWLTGLSGSGKSTVAVEVEKQLYSQGKLVYRLDGDNIRHGLNHDLGFTLEDRLENIRRISEVAKLMADAGVIVLCSFVSPTNDLRDLSREIIGDKFSLVFIDTPVEECIKRDPKGLYKKALAGEIKNFTGISQVFEQPDADLVVETKGKTIPESAEVLVEYIVGGTK